MSSEKTAWSGRFEEVPDESTQDFGASLPVDKRLWREDIDGSIAHATMLASQGLLSEEELSAIKEGLVQIAAGIEAGTITWHSTDEDIHMAIESELIERIGQAGKKLHTARSRNDQVATDLRLWTKQQISGDEGLLHALQDVREALRARASEHSHTIMPGYTHLQKAQPIRLADHLGAYIEMFTRDMFRMKAAFDAADVNVLGSGALAGTSHIINRDMTAELMRFRLVGDNTLDGVSDRDFVLDLLYACAVCQMHMSRLCEELILWSTSEFSFATFADTYSTGSSIMPQKKNPDFAELIRGKTGRVYGNLMALLVTLKGLPLAY
ncbi:MAG: argininosuccinate lyase, partial [Actinomycetia bacterium]|nr:argininosuccinate lyase [Actinomycetes bacterium]